MIGEPAIEAHVVSRIRGGQTGELLRGRHGPVEGQVPFAHHLFCHHVKVTSRRFPLGLDQFAQGLELRIDRDEFPIHACPKVADLRPQTIDIRPKAAYVRPQTIDVRPKAAYVRPQTIDVRPETIDVRPQTIDVRPQTIDVRPKTIHVCPETVHVCPETVDIRP
jgi:hypothetical protein